MKKYSGFAIIYLIITLLLVISALLFITYQPQSTGIDANKSVLTTEELPSGDIRMTDRLSNTEIIVPVTYNLTGDADNFTVSFHGIDSDKGPGPRDFSQLQFRHISREGNLYEKVKEEYRVSKEDDGDTVNYSDIKEIKLGNIKGYYYLCPFLVPQECIYLPLENNPQNYLFILKSFSDENNRGYEKELYQILTSLKYIN